MYGIENKYWKSILSIFRKYRNHIEWVKLFGSRARGDARLAADVDFAVSGNAEIITRKAGGMKSLFKMVKME